MKDYIEIELENGIKLVYPAYNPIIRQAFEKEDNTVKTEVALNSAVSNLELLQLTEEIRNQLEMDQAEANFEILMLVSSMTNK